MCKNLRELHIGGDYIDEVPIHALDYLGTAIGAGCMPVLHRLNITMDFKKGGFQSLLHGFCKGASPHLHALRIPLSISTEEITSLDVEENSKKYRTFVKEAETNVKLLAHVLTARKRLGCDGLRELPDEWRERGPVSARVRIVRLTLASLDTLKCDYTLGNEFCAQLPGIFVSEDVLVPQMRRIAFCNAFKNDDNATRVFHSMGRATAFKSVRELYISQRQWMTEAFQALSSMLKMVIATSACMVIATSASME